MRCLVLHPDIAPLRKRRLPENALAEAISLAVALDLEVVAQHVIKLPKAHAGLLFGKGKIDSIATEIENEEIELVLIDGPVSPIQQRNLERRWSVKVLDRTGLILEIFGDRAATREGVLQVDLAALAYQRTRLVRSWTHLERQRGGLSFVGGAGETQIESDRRAIDDAIIRLKRQLQKVTKTRALHRAARKKIPFPIVALVGYTNAGKSTIFNKLTGAEVLAKDMLFATLDPTMRQVRLPSGREIILSDTVGFISELPTQLVAAFRATLEEVLDADLILHVRDITHPETEQQAQDVDDILTELGVSTTAGETMIEVWNKLDLAPDETAQTLRNIAERDDKIYATSAMSGDGLGPLLEAIDKAVRDPAFSQTLRLDFADGRRRAWLFDQNVVTSEVQHEAGYELLVNWSRKQANLYKSL
ncbi:MAG: GTPase HflX [Alphaproteobacteria bacterium]|nr:GTPase HflX [Alphaproteobacteria bacterium]